jgi:hypothetical protein
MKNLEIKPNIFQDDIKQSLLNIIKIRYEVELESFLQINYLADEVFFINHIDKYQKEELIKLEKKVSFTDISEGGTVTDEIANQWYNEKIQRDHYWYFITFQSFLEKRLLEITARNQPAAVKPSEVKTQTKPIKQKKEFKDFFNPDVKIEIIQEIQNEFKGYDNKKMAYLIYLLHKDFNLINYNVNSRDMSRKHFVESLLNTGVKMQGINKCFQANDVELCINDYLKDNDYIQIKKILSKTIV